MLKTFKDLEFMPHSMSPLFGYRACEQFDNGYGVSVVTGTCAYTTKGTYELAITDEEGGLVYDTPITDDVIGHLPPEEVSTIMKEVQELPKRKKDE